MKRVLVARLDNIGDLLLAGPAIRAVADRARVTLLCSPGSREVARLLPGVDSVMTWRAPWVGFDPPPVDRAATLRLVSRIQSERFDAAAILTSFHQSPLPLAHLLRLGGVREIAAVSVDYPGSLLDHRVSYDEGMHEVEQNLSVVDALGFPPPQDCALQLLALQPSRVAPPYVVVHPEASVPARGIPDSLAAETVEALVASGRRVVVTGTSRDSAILLPSRQGVIDLRARTRVAELAAVIRDAEALIVGNTGPAHIAAATSTPVVSIYAPVVPFHRWKPWRVPVTPLGNCHVPCAGCRARTCPLLQQICVSHITGSHVVTALDELVNGRAPWSVTA